MKGVVLNEKDILNDILENDYIDQKRPISCLRILSKHYLNKGNKQEEVINKLNEYMKKNYEGYSEDNWYGKLKGIVKKTQKYNNYKIEHDIILILMAQILSSEFQTIDYRNPDLNGRKISVIPDVVSEEICRFIMLI